MTKKIEQQQKKSLGYFGKMIGLNLLLMAVVALGIVWALSSWLDVYTRHDERIDVPSLEGILAEDAAHFLEEKGLKSMVVDSAYANKRPGTVIEQTPHAGLPVKKGRIVYLTIQAVSARMVKMQDVLQGGSRQALSTLRSLGFVVDSISYVASEMDDLVLSVTANGIEMEPGAEYPYGTKVVLSVGSSHLKIEGENEEIEESWME